MSVADRLQSVQLEINGKGVSDLQDESGHTVQFWAQCVSRFFAYMWPTPTAILDPRRKPVLEYAWASAIYEWSAVDWKDRAGDRTANASKGPHFDDAPGKGASVGWFQGYARESYQALRLYPGLRKELRGLDAEFSNAIPVSYDAPAPPTTNPRNGIRVTGQTSPANIRVLMGDEDTTLRNFLSDFDNLWNPFVSLIGKLKLSVDYATDVMMHFEGNRHPIWRLPDAALRHVMLVYEISGGDSDWLKHVADIITTADGGVDQARQSGNAVDLHNAEGAVLDFSWHFSQVPQTFSSLGIQSPDRDKCRYRELRANTI